MKYILTGYRHPSCKLYKPKVNRKRQIPLFLAAIPFLCTVGTNWIYFLGINLLFKLDPIFLYRWKKLNH